MAKPKSLPPIDRFDVARFWTKVAITTAQDCWEWQGAKDVKGYGFFKVSGQMLKAHRVSYLLATGADPDNGLVCHHCDNPRCVNPAHLYSGDARSNAADMYTRKRRKPVVGERVPGARLTAENVQDIRELYETGRIQQQELAERFGVTPTAISSIVRGVTWRHLPVLHTHRRRVN